MSVPTITVAELDALRKSGQATDVIDVRTPVEFQEVHVPGVRSAPLDALDPVGHMAARNWKSGETLYVMCRSGSRGRQACERFLAAGFSNVVNIDGGVLAWEKAGLPVVRGKKVLSLERQVRIAAGGLVLAGALLALTVHPWFAGLSAFVGAGLMFAGITDTCGMGLLLARMPWNRVRTPGEASCCSH